MKRLSFINTSNDLQATVVDIDDNEWLKISAINQKYIVLVISVTINECSSVRVFDRESGVRFDELSSCLPFRKVHSANFHPSRDHLLFVLNNGLLTLCDLEKHVLIKTFTYLMGLSRCLQLQYDESDSSLQMYYLRDYSSIIYFVVMDKNFKQCSSEEFYCSDRISRFLIFRKTFVATLSYVNMFEVWNLLTNEKLHSTKISETPSFGDCFVPSTQYIIYCLGHKILVFSDSTFDLLTEIEFSTESNTTFIDTVYVSNDDADILILHQESLEGFDVCNLKTGAKEFKPFLAKNADSFRIYQGWVSQS